MIEHTMTLKITKYIVIGFRLKQRSWPGKNIKSMDLPGLAYKKGHLQTQHSLKPTCCMYVCVCMYASTDVSMYVCMYVGIYVCIYVCVYVCRYGCMHASALSTLGGMTSPKKKRFSKSCGQLFTFLHS